MGYVGLGGWHLSCVVDGDCVVYKTEKEVQWRYFTTTI